MKNIEVLKFYPERFLKKGFPEHNERSVPEKTIAHLIKELPAFPEHLQLMYLILFCTGIRKSEVCTINREPFIHKAMRIGCAYIKAKCGGKKSFLFRVYWLDW